MSLGKDMRRQKMGNYKCWENWGNIDTRQDNWSFSFYKFDHPFHSSEHFSWTLVAHDKDCNSARQEHIAGKLGLGIGRFVDGLELLAARK